MEQDGAGEVKPKQEAGGALGLVIRDQQGTEVHFKVKLTTKFEKIFKVYVEKKGLEPSALKFLFDGARIQHHQTPEELGMEDGDSVDCVVEQVGGGLQEAAAGAGSRG